MEARKEESSWEGMLSPADAAECKYGVHAKHNDGKIPPIGEKVNKVPTTDNQPKNQEKSDKANEPAKPIWSNNADPSKPAQPLWSNKNK